MKRWICKRIEFASDSKFELLLQGTWFWSHRVLMFDLATAEGDLTLCLFDRFGYESFALLFDADDGREIFVDESTTGYKLFRDQLIVYFNVSDVELELNSLPIFSSECRKLTRKSG